jgi:hypothetical protein
MGKKKSGKLKSSRVSINKLQYLSKKETVRALTVYLYFTEVETASITTAA